MNSQSSLLRLQEQVSTTYLEHKRKQPDTDLTMVRVLICGNCSENVDQAQNAGIDHHFIILSMSKAILFVFPQWNGRMIEELGEYLRNQKQVRWLSIL